MSEQDTEVVRSFYHCVRNNKFEDAMRLLAPNFVIHEAPSLPLYGGDHNGPQAFVSMVGKLIEAWPKVAITEVEVVDADPYALCLMTADVVSRKGVAMTVRVAELNRVCNGLITEQRVYYFDGPAMAMAIGPDS